MFTLSKKREYFCFQTYVSARTVVVTSLNFSEAPVWEVELLRSVVDRQPVGRQDVGAHDDHHILPGQSGPHDAGLLLVPVGPEHQAETETGGISPRQRGKKTKEPSQRLVVRMKMWSDIHCDALANEQESSWRWTCAVVSAISVKRQLQTSSSRSSASWRFPETAHQLGVAPLQLDEWISTNDPDKKTWAPNFYFRTCCLSKTGRQRLCGWTQRSPPRPLIEHNISLGPGLTSLWIHGRSLAWREKKKLRISVRSLIQELQISRSSLNSNYNESSRSCTDAAATYRPWMQFRVMKKKSTYRSTAQHCTH